MASGKNVGPLRIWKKGCKMPGLMMSRSFGDDLGHEVGIICTPEISEKRLTDDTQVLVVGSDGIMEIVKNKKIAEKLYFLMRTNRKVDIIPDLMKMSIDGWKKVNLNFKPTLTSIRKETIETTSL